jgi:phenylalanyl-tRNA synthetase beta chain
VRVPLSWLRELAPTELSADELAELITHRGVKVEDVLDPWSGLEGVTVARVLAVADHPSSDKLCVATIEHAYGRSRLVVGVRNMKAGDLVPWARPGSRVPGLPEPLGTREIRGVVSEGMLCSPKELAISQDHGGILVLPDLAVGTDLKVVLGLDDAVLDIEVEPNRPDFLSILGVAREVAAATGVPLQVPEAHLAGSEERADQVATVRIDAPEGCPRYVARVLRGVRPATSPLVVQARLTAAGMRPISAVVDATNYTMIELGQPLHGFDMDLLAGPGIVVRYAAEGERLVTLDDVERTLTAEELLICDVERPVALAGIMGGASSEVSDATTNVLLESATFARSGILRSARRLVLHTEASHRFERGVDPEAADRAAARCAALIAEWTGATVLDGVAAAGKVPDRRWVSLRPARASALLGYPVAAEDARVVFDQLGMRYRSVDGDGIEVEIPGYRVDIDREVDLIEEVVRIQGYDRVGSHLPRAPQAGGLPEDYREARRVKDVLRTAGLREVRPAPFVSRDDLALAGDADAVAVTNPLRAEEGFLRTRLLPGLLHAVARNQALGVLSVALFEVGVVFLPGEPFEERRRVAFTLSGAADESWYASERPLDALDARGVLEVLLEATAVSEWALGDPPSGMFHPARSAWVLIGGERAGVMGELHPRVAASLEIEGRVAVGELDLEAMLAGARKGFTLRDIPRLPPVRRDLAFVVPAHVPAGSVLTLLREAGGELLDRVTLFDVYQGSSLPEGTRSLAFSLDFRDPVRTLEHEEVEPVIQRIVSRLAQEGGEGVRSG